MEGFLDPAEYPMGRDVTVVGSVDGTERHKVGDYDYTFAKVDASEVYLWPKRDTVNVITRPEPWPWWGWW